MQAEQSSKSEEHAERARFAALVAPLERADGGRRLGGRNLGLCRDAFAASPHGFAEICSDALARHTRSAIGLLVQMVKDEDHLQRAPRADVIEIRPGVLGSGATRSGRMSLELDEECMACGKRPSIDDGERVLCLTCREGV